MPGSHTYRLGLRWINGSERAEMIELEGTPSCVPSASTGPRAIGEPILKDPIIRVIFNGIASKSLQHLQLPVTCPPDHPPTLVTRQGNMYHFRACSIESAYKSIKRICSTNCPHLKQKMSFAPLS